MHMSANTPPSRVSDEILGGQTLAVVQVTPCRTNPTLE